MSPPTPLARQNTWVLAGAFVALELLVIAVFAYWVVLPLSRRSADDLAALMVLSAQTWAELPPQTRAAFEAELLNKHALAVRTAPPHTVATPGRSPYFTLLRLALARRTGQKLPLLRQDAQDGVWYWARIPAGPAGLSVGVAASRVSGQPLAALALTLLGSLSLAVALAGVLARRLTRPLARLEAASALIGQGGQPPRLPETGPRELVSLSRRFNAMAQQVQELLSARTTLLAGVSHDLRTPLARMRLALELLRENPTPQLLERLEQDIEQMNALIARVLDLARGLTHEAPTPVDLNAWLGRLARDFSTPDSPVQVRCPSVTCLLPANALQRALGNLLQNAQRYAPGGPIDLVAQWRDPDDPGDPGDPGKPGLRLGVLDRGPGIPADQQEAVFAPFVRLEASRSPVTGGSGLGLAIVRELARANGWLVQLAARPGGGLQVWIEAPTRPERQSKPPH